MSKINQELSSIARINRKGAERIMRTTHNINRRGFIKGAAGLWFSTSILAARAYDFLGTRETCDDRWAGNTTNIPVLYMKVT